MTEYWKSQARKYCEFCKCWLADNQVSVSFHENGKKHKENVQKHISQLSKRSAKEAKQKERIDDDMKKMEEAAMAAYLKDVQNNADLTSKTINNMLGQSAGSSKPDAPVITTAGVANKPPAWQEVKNDDGSSYFWNTETNATTWDPPDEYLSVAQQEEQKLRQKKEKKKNDKIKKQKAQEAVKEAEAYVFRSQMRSLAAKSEPAPTAPPAPLDYGPAPRADKPYGSWTAIAHQAEQKLDLQLPKVPEKEVIPPPVEVEPEEVKFGEKRVESLGDGPVEFKRRKFGHAKRNMRQKLDDE